MRVVPSQFVAEDGGAPSLGSYIGYSARWRMFLVTLVLTNFSAECARFLHRVYSFPGAFQC